MACSFKGSRDKSRQVTACPRPSKFSVIIEARPLRERTARMPISAANSFGTRDNLNVGAQTFEIQRLEKLEKQGLGQFIRLPFSLRILLENLLRCEDGRSVRAEDIRALASWKPGGEQKEI